MSAYITWALTQAAGRIFPWVAANPEKVAIATIAFYYERKLTTDIVTGMVGVVWRSIAGGTGQGALGVVGRSLATRWPGAAAKVRASMAFVTSPPVVIATVAATPVILGAYNVSAPPPPVHQHPKTPWYLAVAQALTGTGPGVGGWTGQQL